MRFSIFIFVVYLSALGAALRPPPGRTTVTNEDIRDAILQVVNVVRTTEDKLERHEYRERVLGEHLKKGLISIDKRIKLLEPFKGTINRLDQRLAAVETILMQKDERERIQLQKTFDAVEDIQKNLPLIVDTLKNDIISKLSNLKIDIPKPESTPGFKKEDLDNIKSELGSQIQKVGDTILAMGNNLVQLKEETKNIRDINNKSSENLDKVKRQLSTSEQLLEKYESKLAEYNNRVPEVPPEFYKDQSESHENLVQTLEVQKNNMDQILSDVAKIANRLALLPEKIDLELVEKRTLDSLTSLKPNDTALQTLQDHILDSHRNLSHSIDIVNKSIGMLSDKFNKSSEIIRTEIENLSRVEVVMVQTADSVLDTKRRVEYGVHQIITEMQQLSKSSSKDIQAAIDERFDTFEMSVLDEETGALANLTSKIGHEIDQVWRQIGNMHQQMSASTDTLNKLQNQTDAYVTGSLNVMDNVKGKVGTITSRISEVDENLNYLVMKLSLITQEFNNIKSGLGKALDEMKQSYHDVREKINKGPGPHEIPSEDSVSPS